MKPAEPNAPRILVADDAPDVLEALRLLLKGGGFHVQTVSSPASVLEAIKKHEFDAVLLDLNYARDTTSGSEGLDLLASMQAMDGTLPVVVMTAWSSVEVAVEAMRRGARDFIQKPWENERLIAILRTQAELSRALREGQRLEAENRLLRSARLPSLIANSAAMQPVVELIHRIAPSNANVLITGEHGAGKEVVAQTLHALSPRAAHPMVAVNAGSISEGIFESEMFGHVKGAFTDAASDRLGRFEVASGGTLFLDEVANVPLSQQAKLLRVIEAGEAQRVGSSKTYRVDVRLISATNANLPQEVAAGRFREDLLFRLNTIEIALPPLRDRLEDILPLAIHFLSRHNQRYQKNVAGLDYAAGQVLKNYSWPGNIRELNHVMERAVLLARCSMVGAADLGIRAGNEAPPRFEDMGLEDAEKCLIQKALDRFNGNITQASQALGVSRSALYRRLERYGIKSAGE
jgi:DNA-binding NtrC family response regulator